MSEFPKLTDKQLELLAIMADERPGYWEDIDLGRELASRRKGTDYHRVKKGVYPVLGSLRRLGLVERRDGDPSLTYGIWTLTKKGRKAMGVSDE